MGVEPPRTGAFSDVRARWLPLWAVGGGLALLGLVMGVGGLLGVSVSDEWAGILLYLPMVAWVLLIVGRRARVDLRVLFRWPRLGSFWWVVAGMLVVQFLFSIGAATLTQLVFPGLADALDGVGEGNNLVLAIVGLVVLPPLVEELVFRGVLIERLAVKWGLAIAIVVSSVGFGLLHVDPVGAGMFGVVTALLYLRTGSLWPGILIHAANNAVALASMRLAEPGPLPSTQEALATAAACLALSVPFLAWFLWRHWPRRGAFTPYQWHEWTHGLPPRDLAPVGWSAAPGTPLRLVAGPTALVLSAHGPGGQPLALVPLEQVQAAYPTPVPGGSQVVVLLRDGSWTTLQAAGGLPAANDRLARVIGERAAAASSG
jgi:membrane protease YdiL (CAAX protease family)